MKKNISDAVLSNLALGIFGLGGFAFFQGLSLFIFTSFFAKSLPSGDPPFYFIIQNYIHGACMLAYWIVCLTAGLLITRFYKKGGISLIVFSSIWAAIPVFNFFEILFKSKNILDPQHRVTEWATFSQYLHDCWTHAGWIFLPLIVLGAFLIEKTLTEQRQLQEATPWIKKPLVIMSFFLGLAFLTSLQGTPPSPPPRPSYRLYVPAGLQQNQKYPLVILLSPAGDADQMIRHWQKTADKFKWILLASKEFRNGIYNQVEVFQNISQVIQSGKLHLPIDPKKILVSGLSGGGMGSHTFAFYFPNFISGVIINTGMMDADFLYPQKNRYPTGKWAVFLASPTDFRYNEMKHDKAFLESLGWKTEWLEFQGGHTLAPVEIYEQAAQWVTQQWTKEDVR